MRLLPYAPLQDPHAPGPMLLSALQKSSSLTLKLYHKTPAALAVSNATAAAMRRYVHAQQQKQQGAMQSVASGRGGFVVAAAAGDATTVGAGAAAVSDSGLGELQLMLVRKRLAALVAWRDAAARAGERQLGKGQWGLATVGAAPTEFATVLSQPVAGPMIASAPEWFSMKRRKRGVTIKSDRHREST